MIGSLARPSFKRLSTISNDISSESTFNSIYIDYKKSPLDEMHRRSNRGGGGGGGRGQRGTGPPIILEGAT